MMEIGVIWKRILIGLLCIVQVMVVNSQSHAGFDLRKLEDLKLVDPDGKTGRLTCSGRKGYLFVFLSPECPLCKNYAPVLNRLGQEYDTLIRIFGIVPGKAYSPAEVDAYARDYGITFILFIDRQKKLTRSLGAMVTPEVILTNDKGEVIYRGAIDDWVTDLGKKKLRPANAYLEDALSQFHNDQPVRIKNVTPKGCLINDF